MKPFEKKATQKPAEQESKGKYQGTIKSDFCLFYLGDPTYIMSEKADQVLCKQDKELNYVPQILTVEEIDVANMRTKYGDGAWKDELGNTYAVSTGRINITPFELFGLRSRNVDKNRKRIYQMMKSDDGIYPGLGLLGGIFIKADKVKFKYDDGVMNIQFNETKLKIDTKKKDF